MSCEQNAAKECCKVGKADIAVLSLNPGVDRMLELSSPLSPGGLNRCGAARLYPGSKGANVATLLSRLGGRVSYYSFSGGIYGNFCEKSLAAEGVISYYTHSECGLRENIKIMDCDGVCTELNSRGGPYTAGERDELISALLDTDAKVVCLCGSIPQGVEKGVYNFLIQQLHKKGKICVLDCDGEAMQQGIEAFPDIIKPNLREAEELFISSGLKITTKRKITPVENPWEDCGKTVWKTPETVRRAADICGEISEFFSVRVLCTLGGYGSVSALPDKKEALYCPAPRVVLRGLSGAGDSFLAAYISKLFSGSYENDAALLRFAVAAGSAKVTLDGSRLPTAELIEKMLSGGRAGGQCPHPSSGLDSKMPNLTPRQ